MAKHPMTASELFHGAYKNIASDLFFLGWVCGSIAQTVFDMPTIKVLISNVIAWAIVVPAWALIKYVWNRAKYGDIPSG